MNNKIDMLKINEKTDMIGINTEKLRAIIEIMKQPINETDDDRLEHFWVLCDVFETILDNIDQDLCILYKELRGGNK